MNDVPDDPAVRSRPALSRLALSSAVMGVVALPLVCCGGGFAGALSVLFGMVALDRIKRSGATLRGRGLAWTGIAAGFATTILSMMWISTVTDLQQQWDAQLDNGVRLTFDADSETTSKLALQSWSAASSTSVSAGQIAAFAADVRGRYGAFESLGLVTKDVFPSLVGDHTLTHVVTFDFASGRRTGAVTARLHTPVDSWSPTLQIASILVNDPDAPDGSLVFPPPIATKAQSNDKAGETAGETVGETAGDKTGETTGETNGETKQ